MTASQMQAQFEAWWARKDLPESMKASYYMAWHDSRAELIVELPADCTGSRDGLDELHLAGDIRDQLFDAIKSAGITVKP